MIGDSNTLGMGKKIPAITVFLGGQ